MCSATAFDAATSKVSDGSGCPSWRRGAESGYGPLPSSRRRRCRRGRGSTPVNGLSQEAHERPRGAAGERRGQQRSERMERIDVFRVESRHLGTARGRKKREGQSLTASDVEHLLAGPRFQADLSEVSCSLLKYVDVIVTGDLAIVVTVVARERPYRLRVSMRGPSCGVAGAYHACVLGRPSARVLPPPTDAQDEPCCFDAQRDHDSSPTGARLVMWLWVSTACASIGFVRILVVNSVYYRRGGDAGHFFDHVALSGAAITSRSSAWSTRRTSPSVRLLGATCGVPRRHGRPGPRCTPRGGASTRRRRSDG